MSGKARILYVEDDQALSFVTKDNLELKGYDVVACEDGESALMEIQKTPFDLCVLDVMLPKMDGFTLAEKIREFDYQVPILFLSARATHEDKIHGLQLGGDDYITKPFSLEELVLKIEVFLKRSKIITNEPTKQPIILGRFTFFPSNHLLKYGTEEIPLTYRESDLLNYLVQRSDSIVKREEILLSVWNNDHYFASRSMDVFISRLRKILKPEPRIKIESVHNVGYRFRVE